jgi:predicted amidohydrolase
MSTSQPTSYRDIAQEIAQLAADVDLRWPEQPFVDRFGQSARLDALLGEARAAGQAVPRGAFHPRDALEAVLDWCGRATPRTHLHEVACLLACDELLVPGPTAARPADHVGFSREGYQTRAGARIIVYCHPRPAWRDQSPSPTPVEVMRPVMQSRLRALRYFVLDGGSRARVDRLPELAEVEMQSLANAASLRVGLFPLHGYHALFELVDEVQSHTLGTTVHGYRAHSIIHHGGTFRRFLRCGHPRDPRHYESYIQQLRAVVDTARKLRIDIIVLPELTVDGNGLQCLRERLRSAADTQHPSLIFAGSWHLDRNGRYVNECAILGRDGYDILRPQQKSNHYAFQPRRLFRGVLRRFAGRTFAAGISGADTVGAEWLSHWYAENISLAATHQIIPTPFGVFAVGICADVLPTASTSPFAQVCALPVDWLVVPSYNPVGDATDFMARAKDFARTNGIFLYVNADCTPASIIVRGLVSTVCDTTSGIGRGLVRAFHRILDLFRSPSPEAIVNFPRKQIWSSLTSGLRTPAIVDVRGEGIDGLVVDLRHPSLGGSDAPDR